MLCLCHLLQMPQPAHHNLRKQYAAPTAATPVPSGVLYNCCCSCLRLKSMSRESVSPCVWGGRRESDSHLLLGSVKKTGFYDLKDSLGIQGIQRAFFFLAVANVSFNNRNCLQDRGSNSRFRQPCFLLSLSL